jgi:hypothetical protein
MAIAAGIMFLEGNRGIIPALIDFIGILLGLIVTRIVYVPLSEHMLASTAYILLFLAVIIATAFLSVVITRRLRIHVTPVEAAIGASLGLGTALLISYALFEWLAIRYGIGYPLVSNSLLNWAMNEFAALRELSEFFGHFLGK